MEPKATSALLVADFQVHTFAPTIKAAEPNDEIGRYTSEGTSHFIQGVENDVPNAGWPVARVPSADLQPAMPKPVLATPPEQNAVHRETEARVTPSQTHLLLKFEPSLCEDEQMEAQFTPRGNEDQVHKDDTLADPGKLEALPASPVRAHKTSAAHGASPVIPPSAGKRELNEAAMALTWLAEAITAPGAVSPLPIRSKNASLGHNSGSKTKPAILSEDRNNQRGRRAASQRCSFIIQETILADRELAMSSKCREVVTPKAEPAATKAPRKAPGPRASNYANGAPTERKPKIYSNSSRVGRAMSYIHHFIHTHQPSYNGAGVPERAIRQEFGNNPDTSKALRFLVTENKIIRSGVGGRRDPFSYTIADPTAALPQLPNQSHPYPRERSPISPVASTAGDRALALETLAAAFTPNTALAAAAAATLAAPSTGPKLALTLASAEDINARRKALQPRLSLAMAELPSFKAGGQSAETVFGSKRGIGLSSFPSLQRPSLAKRPALDNGSMTPVAPQVGGAAEGPGLSLGDLATPAAVGTKSNQRILSTQWNPQLFSPLAMPSGGTPPMGTPFYNGNVMPMPPGRPGLSAANFIGNGTTPTAQQAAQAYMMHIQAVQMLWQKHIGNGGVQPVAKEDLPLGQAAKPRDTVQLVESIQQT